MSMNSGNGSDRLNCNEVFLMLALIRKGFRTKKKAFKEKKVVIKGFSKMYVESFCKLTVNTISHLE